MASFPRRERRTVDEQQYEVERRMIGPTLGGRSALVAPVARRPPTPQSVSAGGGPAIKYIQDDQPGTMKPRELWLDTDEPAPSADVGGGIADLGWFKVSSSPSTSLTTGSFYTLDPTTEVNSLTNPGDATWDTDHFVIVSPGLYVMDAYVILDGTVTDGTMQVQSPWGGHGPVPIYTQYGGSISGFDVAGWATSPPIASAATEEFEARLFANGTGMTIVNIELTLRPIALF